MRTAGRERAVRRCVCAPAQFSGEIMSDPWQPRPDATGPYAPQPGPTAQQPGPTAQQRGFGAPQPDPYAYAPLPQGGGYGFGPPPQRGGTNGFAVAGLVLGILPGLAGILGIVFGAIGLRQIKRTGQDGRGMALAGVILGSIWLVLLAVLIVVAVATDSDSDDSSSAGLPGLFGSSSPSPGSSPSP